MDGLKLNSTRKREVRIIAVFTAVIFVFLVILAINLNKTPVSVKLPKAEVLLNQKDRLLILAPHPDDEVLGCGGIIQQAVAMNIPVHIVFLTYGDFYEWSFIIYKRRPVLTAKGVMGMGEIRHDEALAAADVLGLSKEDVEFLGYPDFGTLDMWEHAWGQSKPVQGRLTEATSVPYKDAFRPGARYKGDEVLKDLTSIIRKFRPSKIFVSHPADHHPDHRAMYLFTRVALFNLEEELSPEIYPYLVHYANWPNPKGYFPNRTLLPPKFLVRQISWMVRMLNTQEETTKLAALKKHQTQYKATPEFLDSFVRKNELFGDFPIVILDDQSISPSLIGNTTHELIKKDEIIEKDKAFLAGIVGWTAKREGQSIILSIEMTHPLTQEVGSSVYLFGYRGDKPFSEMPKLHIKLGPLTHKVYNMSQEIPFDKLQVTYSGRNINIRVPLELIGNPQKILTSVRTYAGVIPLDWGSWRILSINDVTNIQD